MSSTERLPTDRKDAVVTTVGDARRKGALALSGGLFEADPWLTCGGNLLREADLEETRGQ